MHIGPAFYMHTGDVSGKSWVESCRRRRRCFCSTAFSVCVWACTVLHTLQVCGCLTTYIPTAYSLFIICCCWCCCCMLDGCFARMEERMDCRTSYVFRAVRCCFKSSAVVFVWNFRTENSIAGLALCGKGTHICAKRKFKHACRCRRRCRVVVGIC